MFTVWILCSQVHFQDNRLRFARKQKGRTRTTALGVPPEVSEGRRVGLISLVCRSKNSVPSAESTIRHREVKSESGRTSANSKYRPHARGINSSAQRTELPGDGKHAGARSKHAKLTSAETKNPETGFGLAAFASSPKTKGRRRNGAPFHHVGPDPGNSGQPRRNPGASPGSGTSQFDRLRRAAKIRSTQCGPLLRPVFRMDQKAGAGHHHPRKWMHLTYLYATGHF